MASVAKREWTHAGETKTAWVCRYKGADGKRRMKTFEKKRDADAFRTKIEDDIARGRVVLNEGRPTVASICNAFARWTELRVSDGRIGAASMKNINRAMDTIIAEVGDLRHGELTVKTIHELYAKLTKTGGLAPVTAKKRLGIFAEAEKYAFRQGTIRHRTVSDALTDLKGLKQNKVKTFMLEDVAALLRAAEARPRWVMPRSTDMLRCFVHLAAFCGLRFGEINGLLLRNIDFDRGLILVRHSLSEIDGLKAPKTAAGTRDVPMPPHVEKMLRDWVARHCLANEQGLVFGSVNGTPLTAANFHNLMWRPLLKRAGLDDGTGKRLHFHALRHFFASLMVDANMSLTDVAKLMGHSSFDMTLQVYSHSIRSGSDHHSAAIAAAAEGVLTLPRMIDATTNSAEPA